jgi:hypothetical protein
MNEEIGEGHVHPEAVTELAVRWITIYVVGQKSMRET